MKDQPTRCDFVSNSFSQGFGMTVKSNAVAFAVGVFNPRGAVFDSI